MVSALKGSGAAVRGLLTEWHSIGRPELEPIELGEMEAKTSVAAIFHLFNFPDFHGGQHQASAPAGCDLLVLESECWKTSVQALPQEATAQAWKQIRNEGGCVSTHMVKMERKDGARFSGKDVQAQCHLLANFLSFVKGTRCRPVCGVGFDAAQQETWRIFASPRSGVSAYSWFNPFEASQAECLYPLFAQRWHQSEHWEDCLRSTIYWYTQANTNGVSVGIDAAIILAQAALERLAHHYLVVEGTMTLKHFVGLTASKRLRELFSGLKLPVDICDLSPEIQKVAARWEWLDAPHALTDIRNELVHPVSKRQIANCLIDAWRLSLWYLELSVLALCGYEGTYTNRLAAKIVTDSESVPWA